jgi:hypothetical protein
MIATTIYNTYRFCNVTGRSSGMVPPILLLLSILHSIDSKKKMVRHSNLDTIKQREHKLNWQKKI